LKYPGYRKIKEILAVARGEKKGDILLTNCRIVDFFRGEILNSDVTIKNGIIAGTGKDYEGEETLDCKGKFLTPGFIDAHIHIESSHLLPSFFGAEAAKHGTTTIITDPHEIGNALGKRGIKFFIKNSQLSPIDIFFLVPSCVPAIKLWDIYGNEIGEEEIRELLSSEKVLGLAEMMNFPGVINGDREVWGKLAAAWERIKDGHAPLVSGKALNAYLIGGIGSDHESTRVDEALEKISRGMMVMIREGSAAKNLDILPGVVNRYNFDRISLVSDDLLPTELFREGHIDRIMRRARKKYNLDPYLLIRMVTFNPAIYMQLTDRGIVAPGKIADLVILEDLDDFRVSVTIKNGKIVYDAEKGYFYQPPKPSIPSYVAKSVKLPLLRKEDFIYSCDKNMVRAIEIIPDQIITREIKIEPSRKDGKIVADPERDLNKIAVIDRYTGRGKRAVGLVKGLGLKRGAIASTYAHDTHNLIISGVNDEDMAFAGNRVREMGGGMVVVENKRILAEFPLPVGGVVSDLPAVSVAEKMEKLNSAARKLGTHLPDPFVTLSFLSLSVIPELKITPAGLVNLSKMERSDC